MDEDVNAEIGYGVEPAQQVVGFVEPGFEEDATRCGSHIPSFVQNWTFE